MSHSTIDSLKAIFDKEKLERISFKNIIENFTEGNDFQHLLNIPDHVMQEFYECSLMYLKDHQYAEASDCFLFLCALSPFEANLWIKAGNAAHSLQRFEEALQAYSMAMICDADDPFPHLYSAEIYITRNDHHQAHAELEMCRRLILEHSENFALMDLVNQLEHKFNS